MAWDYVLFGVLTGGLYNIVKAGYKAGESAEDAGIALAVIGSTVEALGKQLESLLKKTDELITININSIINNYIKFNQKKS